MLDLILKNYKDSMIKRIKEIIYFSLAISIILLAMHISGIGCPIKYVTGISCAGCGMSRALLAVLHLDFRAAFHYHPLYWIVLIFPVIYICKDKIPGKAYKVTTFIVVMVFIVVYIIRLADPDDTIVNIDFQNSAVMHLINYIGGLR